MPEPILRLAGVKKSFGDFEAVSDIDLDIFEGEFITIVGPSGSGKTTLLRMLIGELAPDSGRIKLGTKIEMVYLDQTREPLALSLIHI